jgi:hypothetical protein
MVTSFQPATLGKRSQVSPIPAADPKDAREFRKLAAWAATMAEATQLEVLKAKSDRDSGMDSRRVFRSRLVHSV